MADNIRDDAPLQKSLSYVYNTDINQLAACVAAGANVGRSKLLWALALSTLLIHRIGQCARKVSPSIANGDKPLPATADKETAPAPKPEPSANDGYTGIQAS